MMVTLTFNPLSANSDQKQFSPNNIHTLSRDKVMRINQMITKEKMPWSFIKFSQLILKGNVWRSVWRICMWILGLKGLTTATFKAIIISLAHEAKSRSWWWCADFFSKDTVRLNVNLTALIPAAPPELCWDEGGDCVDEPESERESWDNIGGVLSISSCDDKNNVTTTHFVKLH